LQFLFAAKVLIPLRKIAFSDGIISVELMKMDVKTHFNASISSLINALNTDAQAQSNLS